MESPRYPENADTESRAAIDHYLQMTEGVPSAIQAKLMEQATRRIMDLQSIRKEVENLMLMELAING